MPVQQRSKNTFPPVEGMAVLGRNPFSRGDCIVAADPGGGIRETGGNSMESDHKLTKLSQTLRKNQTKEENLLWYNFLRRYPLQFRRQYKIGSYIVDFYCHKARLVVELDGSQHYDPDGKVRDALRTQYLESAGLKVLRFSNLEVTRQFQGVCEAIDLSVRERTASLSNRKS